MGNQYTINMEKRSLIIIKISIGLYFILSPILFKIIIIRLPKSIFVIKTFFVIFLLLLFFIISVKILYNAFFFKKKNKITEIMVKNIIKPLNDFYWGNLHLIDNYIKHNIMGPDILGKNLLKLGAYINNYLYDRNSIRYLILFLLMDVVPKIVLLCLSFTDVFIFQEFSYIYKWGWVGLIPLCFRYILYTFRGFSEYNITYMHEGFLYFFTLKGEELTTSSLLENCKNIYHKDTIDSFGVPQRRVALRQEANTKEENDIILDDYLLQFDSFMQLHMSVYVFDSLRKDFWYILFTFYYYFFQFNIWLYIFILHILI